MYSLESATQTANRVVELLAPHCERIHIAGSIRRKKETVKDIEVVCQPIKVFVKDKTDLFGAGDWAVSPEFIKTIEYFTYKIEKGKYNGRYMKIILKGHTPLDLFMPEPIDYFRQLVIRTGSSDYVHHVVAASWKQKGWCGTSQGLRLISECTGTKTADNKTTWKCTALNPILPPVWQSEEEFFEWLGLPFTPPECRELSNSVDISE